VSEWIIWSAPKVVPENFTPVHPDAMVTIRFGDGDVNSDVAKRFYWGELAAATIVAYRIISQPDDVIDLFLKAKP
jgi:hypothetical protein